MSGLKTMPPMRDLQAVVCYNFYEDKSSSPTKKKELLKIQQINYESNHS